MNIETETTCLHFVFIEFLFCFFGVSIELATLPSNFLHRKLKCFELTSG